MTGLADGKTHFALHVRIVNAFHSSVCWCFTSSRTFSLALFFTNSIFARIWIESVCQCFQPFEIKNWSSTWISRNRCFFNTFHMCVWSSKTKAKFLSWVWKYLIVDRNALLRDFEHGSSWCCHRHCWMDVCAKSILNWESRTNERARLLSWVLQLFVYIVMNHSLWYLCLLAATNISFRINCWDEQDEEKWKKQRQIQRLNRLACELRN